MIFYMQAARYPLLGWRAGGQCAARLHGAAAEEEREEAFQARVVATGGRPLWEAPALSTTRAWTSHRWTQVTPSKRSGGYQPMSLCCHDSSWKQPGEPVHATSLSQRRAAFVAASLHPDSHPVWMLCFLRGYDCC